MVPGLPEKMQSGEGLMRVKNVLVGIAVLATLARSEFAAGSIDYMLGEGTLDYSFGYTSAYETESRTVLLLAIAARDYPDHPRAAEITAKLMQQLHHVLAGNPHGDGNLSPEPKARGGGASEGWRIPGLAGALAIVRHTPALWAELGNDTPEKYQERADMLMKALAVAANWTMDDDNNFNADITGKEFNKDHNPNHQEGYVGVAIAASVYFGAANNDPAKLDTVFDTFDYDTYVAAFESYGWKNILSVWRPADDALALRVRTLMHEGGPWPDKGTGAGIKGNHFTYFGLSGDKVFDIYAILADRMFFYNVTDTIAHNRFQDYSFEPTTGSKLRIVIRDKWLFISEVQIFGEPEIVEPVGSLARQTTLRVPGAPQSNRTILFDLQGRLIGELHTAQPMHTTPGCTLLKTSGSNGRVMKRIVTEK